jgi:hypothetical protein
MSTSHFPASVRKDGKLVPSHKHLPANLQLQKRASKRVRVAKPVR